MNVKCVTMFYDFLSKLVFFRETPICFSLNCRQLEIKQPKQTKCYVVMVPKPVHFLCVCWILQTLQLERCLAGLFKLELLTKS